MTLTEEIARRRTFAIISHPDAGKTTLTEKLLLYGGAIHLAGSVRARKNMQSTASDWMDLEKKRGISITSTALEFPYKGYQINLLDTPGHHDFQEDTFRTLVAADAAVMLIDSAKGVEPQTLKLFEVCRNRGIPIFTFFNKMDRPAQDPLDLIDEVERTLGIQVFPMNWPLGSGTDFRGVYDRKDGVLHVYERTEHGKKKAPVHVGKADDPYYAELAGPDVHRKLIDDIELLEAVGTSFDEEKFHEGRLTPAFFGSAVTNFGIEAFLDRFVELAPAPSARLTVDGRMHAVESPFSGFIFKIQANMDPAHRDRIAFLRICSGKFERGMTAQHSRLGKALRLSQAHRLFGQERVAAEEGWPGDIIGIISPGSFALGDTLHAGDAVEFEPIPRFAPEFFASLRVENPSQRDPFLKGVSQLMEEGAVQVLYRRTGDIREPVLAAQGPLQFEVVQYRLESEYRVATRLERMPFTGARWVM
ncbi:MAG: peptide chain release factor 3, partial [Proteobacteria bacterium]|nr:peptide chain release factor 3 [Pseudomonadota bacterium]